MVRSSVATIAALLLTTAACAAPRAPAIGEAELRDTIATIADDSFEGRKPGTPGGQKTEQWLAAAFARAGLSPAGDGGGWRQPVPLVTRAAGEATLGQVPAAEMLLLGTEPTLAVTAPVRRADAADLKGAIVLAPLPANARSYGRLDETAAALAAKGAVAVLFVVPGDDQAWQRARGDLGARTLAPGQGGAIPVGAISARGAALIRSDGPQPLVARTTITPLDTANIVGRVRGRDRRAGAVVLMAHWDHLGLCRPEGAPDRICNGATDNASGISMLVAIAKRIAAGPRPRRDIYVVATTAEEMGLLGAGHFAEHPPAPIVAALNLDTSAIAPAGMPVATIGRGRWPALDRVIDQTTVKAGRRVDADQEAAVMTERQDGWALARRGVPAVMVSGSFSDMNRLTAYLRSSYHGPDDDLAHLPTLAGAAEDANLHVALARALADPKLYPAPAAPQPQDK